jgi:hypothetical protein
MRGFVQSLLCILVVLTANAHAGDEDQRDMVQRILMASRDVHFKLDYPFVTQMYVQREQGNFTLSSGRGLLSVNDTATSAYDEAITHNISDFYKATNTRQRWVLNYLEPDTRWLFSFGYDSGTQADKLSIEQSVFLGLAKNFELSRDHHLMFSWGQWFGGKVTDRPCLDAYDREYWCPNLSAWTDRPALDTTPGKYYELKYQWLF